MQLQSRFPRQKFLRTAALLLLFLSLIGAASGQSALDGFDPDASDGVRVTVVQPDGKILIGGYFTSVQGVARNKIARLNPDGTLDTVFDPNVGGLGGSFVKSIALQADGKILVGGFFTTVSGQPRNYIARLDAVTGLADSFDPNAGGPVRSIVVQADGKILVGGFFTTIGGETRNYIARLDPSTGLADSFDPDASYSVDAIAIQADGKILVGGGFTSIGGQARNYIARLDPTTGLADSFDPDASSSVFTIALQADGKILAGGNFIGIGGETRNYIARLDPVTGLADSFDPNAGNTVLSVVVEADGKILVGGFFSGPNSMGGQARNYIARLDAATGLADSFDPSANDLVAAIAVQPDGKILVGGDFTTLAPNGGAAVPRNRIARLETDGRLDQTLNLNLEGEIAHYVLASAVQPDGKIVIGGQFTSVLGQTRNNIARLNTDGTLDLAFDPNASNGVNSIAVQADGKILVGGAFISIGGRPRTYFARLDSDGLADSFNPIADGSVFAIAVQPDGMIVVGGFFSNIGGEMRSNIARLDPATGLADPFNPIANSGVRCILVQADGKILAGGHFTSIGDEFRNYIARLDPTTGLADAFDPSANNAVLSIALQTDGKVLAAGGFTNIGGQPRSLIARLNPATGLADSFNPDGTGSEVDSMALQADGKILAGGFFTSMGGHPRNYLARIDPITGLADSFDPNADFPVYSITPLADGKILVGGLFESIGGEPRAGCARLSNDTAALQNLAVTQTGITWTRGGSSPQFERVTFESSTDDVNYTALGEGTADGTNWTLADLNLPIGQNIFVRALGQYSSGYFNGSESLTESVRNAFLVGPSTFGNLSTRLAVGTGDNVLIGGFIITGTQPKKIIVRAIGPSLALAGVLADPVLELRDSDSALIASNDNWRSDQEGEIIATMLPPGDDLESAIVATLPANDSAYTAIVRGANDGTGIGLVEVYDLDQTVDSKLANISTRGFVQTDDNVLIGGLIVLGQDPLQVVVRAIGPSLPVPGALGDPTLELHDGNGALLAFNDNWRSDQEAEIIATGLPPTDDLESAIVRDLVPSNYTVIVRGVSDTTGVALVEAYGLE